ncbi:hypothetical protein MKP08_09015 [Erythrobacter sp. LQ02-29]|uniref:hypothetical protein n=1 Tax=Erythrobacter sp. LQ02-29 TaxID=2920384 RepID=UPI001F4EC0DF|nr:hypothetical protein [Erythrobacter sp. LQ02-29]MCP9222885.1 hypothetical protein [Erythrobacter sp. LQ02-29]
MTRLPSLLAGLAAASMAVVPISASAAQVETPVSPAVYDQGSALAFLDADAHQYDRRWRDRRYRHHRDDNGITGTDILIGAAVIGGLAALATASQKPREEPRYEPQYNDDYPQAPDQAYNDQAYDDGYAPADGQYDDQTYYNARARAGSPAPDAPSGAYDYDPNARSDYPGGPPADYYGD